MTPSRDTMTNFYQQLGKVFYALAAADKVVHQEELQVLGKVVKSEWLDVDQTFDEFGTDTAFQIQIVFDWLNDKHVSAAGALSSLEAFRKDHPSIFTSQVKQLIMKTARAITSSFQNDDESQLALLNRLDRVLAN